MGIEQLSQAVLARRGVGGDRRIGHGTPEALPDGERGVAARLAVVDQDPLDHGEWRCLRGQPGQELLDRVRAPLDFDQYAVGVVEHEPAKRQLVGEPVDIGTEPHALHGAGHADACPAGHDAHPTISTSA